MGRALTVIVVFGVTVALLFARAPDALRAPQFWAEDAVIFWVQQYEHGFLGALLRPSAGYQHVMPRLIAADPTASVQRRLALNLSSVAEPGQSSFSPSALSGAATVARLPCRSSGSLST